MEFMNNYKKQKYQDLVLSHIKENGMGFVLDRNFLFRGLAVGIIPKEGIFTTPEIITGGETGQAMFVPFYNSNKLIDKIYPTVDWQANQAIFPLISSDGSKIVESGGVMVNIVSSCGQSEEFSSSAIYTDTHSQDISLLSSSNKLIKVTADSTLFNGLENSGQWAVGHLSYFIIQLDFNGTGYLSMDYLDVKVKYTTFCKIANFYFPEEKKTGAYFDYIYINREEKIYKPIFEKFIKNSNSTNLCH